MTKKLKNSNWEFLTKNLATLKDKMGLRMKNFNILGVHWKIWLSGGGSWKTNMEGGLPKKGGLDILQIQEGLGKKGGGMFLIGVWYPNAHYA